MAGVSPTVKRGTVRRAITKLITKLKDIDADGALHDEQKCFEFKEKLAALHDKHKQVLAFDKEIIDACTTDTSYDAATDDAAEVSEKTTDAITLYTFKHSVLDRKLKEEKADRDRLNNPPLPPPTPTPTQPVLHSLQHKFSLPDFGGDIILFSPFWDVFESEVHKNQQYSGATKFNLLNSCLKGEAKAAIAGLSPTNDNYPQAVQILKERYGNAKKVQAAYMRALYNIEKPSDSRSSLRAFLDRLESLIRGLEAQKVNLNYAAGDLLVNILQDKLSVDVRRALVRAHGSTDFDLDDFRKALKHEIEILDEIPQTQRRPQQSDSASHSGRDRNQRQQSTNSSTSSQSPRRCHLCKGEHFVSECTKFVTATERSDQAKKLKLCFNCLSDQHMSKECQSRNRCKTCAQKHHTSLHFEERSSTGGSAKPPVKSNDNKGGKPENVHEGFATAAPSESRSQRDLEPFEQHSFTFLKTAVALVRSIHSQSTAKIFLDEGAQRTLVTSRLAKQLNLRPIFREKLKLSGFQSSSDGVKPQLYDVTSLSIVDREGQSVEIEAIILEHIANPLQNPHRVAVSQLPHVRGLPLAHPTTYAEPLFSIDILVGADHFWSIVTDKVVKGDGPTAVSSRLGYLLSGPFKVKMLPSSIENVATIQVTTIEQFDLERFWQVEHLGIQPPQESGRVDTLVTYLQYGIQFNGTQYVARFPWKQAHPELKSNYFMALKRTEAVVKRLSRSPDKLSVYACVIQKQLDNGFLERVPWSNKPGCHYVSHFPVENPESTTTPVRSVMDWAMKTTDGVSLNDCLETGEPLQNNILDILINFRLWRFGIIFDIEKAFHKILLHPDDQDFTRFFWLTNPLDPSSPFGVLRSRVVPMGARPSPFILHAILRYHLAKFSPSAEAADILRNMYVDNFVSGRDTKEEAIKLFIESNAMMGAASMDLKSWGSSDPSLEAKAVAKGVADSNAVSKVLAFRWDRKEDSLRLPPLVLASFYKDGATKRDVLRGIATVYDPMGWYSPLTTPAKLIIQELWWRNLGWDDPIPSDLFEWWKSVTTALENVQMTLPRSYLGSSSAVHDVHVFVDSSKRAYGAWAGAVHNGSSAFIMSKAKVAPLKVLGRGQPTIPLLELFAASLGVDMASTLIRVFQSNGVKVKITFWSDNQAVLYQIHRTEKHKCQIVNSRTNTIRAFNEQHNAVWRWVPTDSNPADLLTRGLTFEQFQSSDLWKYGPKWLTDPEAHP